MNLPPSATFQSSSNLKNSTMQLVLTLFFNKDFKFIKFRVKVQSKTWSLFFNKWILITFFTINVMLIYYLYKHMYNIKFLSIPKTQNFDTEIAEQGFSSRLLFSQKAFVQGPWNNSNLYCRNHSISRVKKLEEAVLNERSHCPRKFTKIDRHHR